MKKGIIGIACLLAAASCRAQLLGGFFEQNATRKQDNEQQVAALGAFITVSEKGYRIVESGLSTIKGIKSGEFDLHSTFYSSLKSINPSIGNMGEVAEIIALQAATAERVSAALSRYRQNGGLGVDELTAVGQVFQAVVNVGTADVNMLIQLLTAGVLQMTDDQRIAGIRELDAAARTRYGQTSEITDQADLLCLQRQTEAARIGTVRGLYGLP
jgi:hypothetical protein